MQYDMASILVDTFSIAEPFAGSDAFDNTVGVMNTAVSTCMWW